MSASELGCKRISLAAARSLSPHTGLKSSFCPAVFLANLDVFYTASFNGYIVKAVPKISMTFLGCRLVFLDMIATLNNSVVLFYVCSPVYWELVSVLCTTSGSRQGTFVCASVVSNIFPLTFFHTWK